MLNLDGPTDVTHFALFFKTTLQLFLEMEKIDILSIIKLNTLESIFGIVCPMLKTTIKKYKTQNSLAGKSHMLNNPIPCLSMI